MTDLRIGVDVDGVLAEFNSAYKKLIEKMTAVRLPDISEFYPNTWSYEKAAGVSDAEMNAIWSHIRNNTCFWRELPPYDETENFLMHLGILEVLKGANIYFVTSRVGKTAKAQTENWLAVYGFNNATVLITSEKGLCAKALKLTHYIDDKNENCVDVRDNAPSTKGFMLAAPWNQAQEGVPRLTKVKEFITILKEAKDA